MKQLSVILMGGGNRGNRYLKAMMKMPGKSRVAAIAEPVKAKREYLKNYVMCLMICALKAMNNF